MDKDNRKNQKDKLKELIGLAASLSYVNPDDIPAIELYMDQVTTFMEKKLDVNKRTEIDKVMTKTMINNYTKNNLLPPPVKKKYSKEHIILLIYIYYLKNFVSINDIQTLLKPVIDNEYYHGSSPASIEDIYKTIYDYGRTHYNDTVREIISSYNKASSMFDPQEDEYMHDMSMVALLSLDVYVKKKCIEHLIDDMRREQEAVDEKKASKAEASKKNEASKNTKKPDAQKKTPASKTTKKAEPQKAVKKAEPKKTVKKTEP